MIMKKQPLWTLGFLLISGMVFSQNDLAKKPNYKKIEKEISREKSELFYPKLLQRFSISDSTMTLKEKRYLYYGYSFQENYSPYGHSGFGDSLKTVLQLEKHSEKELNKILRLSDSILAKNPFDLRVINYQLYALQKQNNTAGFDKKKISNERHN